MFLYVVTVAAAVPFLDDISGFGEVSDDRVRAAFGDIERGGEVSQSGVGLFRDEEQGSCVFREEGPVAHAAPLSDDGLVPDTSPVRQNHNTSNIIPESDLRRNPVTIGRSPYDPRHD